MRRHSQHIGNKMVQRRGVALDVGLKRQRLAAAHNGNTVIAQRSRQQNFVSGLAIRSAKVDAVGNKSHATCVDEHAVAVALVHHFRVARDQLNTRLSCGFRHGRANALHVIHRVALFKHKSARQVLHARAACGNIVDGTADGKLADVAAGKEMGRYHKRVGRKRNTLVMRRSRQNGRIIAFQQNFIAIRLKEHFVDNALHHRSARAMPQHYCFIHQKPPCEKRKLAIVCASNVKCYLIFVFAQLHERLQRCRWLWHYTNVLVACLCLCATRMGTIHSRTCE